MKGNSYDCIFRNHPQTIGFTTYKKPVTSSNAKDAFYSLETEYADVYQSEIISLKRILHNYRYNKFILAPLGKELEPWSYIFLDFIIHRVQKDLKEYTNIVYNW